MTPRTEAGRALVRKALRTEDVLMGVDALTEDELEPMAAIMRLVSREVVAAVHTGHWSPRPIALAILAIEAEAAAPDSPLTYSGGNADVRLNREAAPDSPLDAAPDERFVRLATAVMGLRDFLALHRKATGRSDVNIRKVLRLLDELLTDNLEARGEADHD